MATHKWAELKKERYAKAPERRAKIEKEVEEGVVGMNLASLREITGLTQGEVAAVVGTSQAEISRSERRADHLVSTLQAYVKGLGGELILTARFGDKSVRMKGV